MKIYTRTGDDGSTGLLTGERVAKTDLRIEACGVVDEMNSLLGVARAANPSEPVDKVLVRLQNELFALGASLAARGADRFLPDESLVPWLEGGIDEMSEELPPLKHFILPGGSPAAAAIHVARAVCRRAERRVTALAATEVVAPATGIILNRLSDFLFTLARYENHLRGVDEPKWISLKTANGRQ